MIDINNKTFVGVSNDPNGEVDGNTTFTYHQEGDTMWGLYGGGSILRGTLSGIIIDDNTIRFNYCHVNQDHELLSGQCTSVLEVLSDGRYRFHESWLWTGGKSGTGTSIVEEIKSS